MAIKKKNVVSQLDNQRFQFFPLHMLNTMVCGSEYYRTLHKNDEQKNLILSYRRAQSSVERLTLCELMKKRVWHEFE